MSKSKVEEKYQKKDLHQHILDLPDTYIGSTEKDTREVWVFDRDINKITKRKIEYIAGLFNQTICL